jgi:hypothetical protein
MYVFLSATEKNTHELLFHQEERKRRARQTGQRVNQKREHKCTTPDCGIVFENIKALQEHQAAMFHRPSRKRRAPSVSIPKVCSCF